VTALPASRGWVFEPKFDGFRALAFCNRSGVRLQSRQQRWLTDSFPDITVTLSGLADEQVVLDGELVIWRDGRFDFAALQDRLRAGPARTRALAAEVPAAYVVFDLLAHRHRDLRDEPYLKRRRRLEKLLTTHAGPPGVVLTPSTDDLAVAHSWLRGYTSSGIEGVVAKHADQPYRPETRGWQKLRTRHTAEALVAGIIGRLDAPQVLLLGRPDPTGRLHLVGRTTTLSPTTRTTIATVLRPPPGTGHPWPATLPRSRWGRGPAAPLAYTQVRPEVVVELLVDPVVDGPRWRHPPGSSASAPTSPHRPPDHSPPRWPPPQPGSMPSSHANPHAHRGGDWLNPDRGRVPFGEYATRWVAERDLSDDARTLRPGAPRPSPSDLRATSRR
jgi:ATP-dependent DNA ligase